CPPTPTCPQGVCTGAANLPCCPLTNGNCCNNLKDLLVYVKESLGGNILFNAVPGTCGACPLTANQACGTQNCPLAQGQQPRLHLFFDNSSVPQTNCAGACQ